MNSSSWTQKSSDWFKTAPNDKIGCLELISNDGRCPVAWDEIICWPPADPGEYVSVPCSAVNEWHERTSRTDGEPSLIYHDPVPVSSDVAYRICNSTGQWQWENWTNYSLCLNGMESDQNEDDFHRQIILSIIFYGSFVSIIFLITSLWILFHYKILECPRIRVHRNLMVSLLIDAVTLIMFTSSSIDSMCKVVLSLKMYSSSSTIIWMFIEGLMLNQRLTTQIFETSFPFKLYYLIGWIFPTSLTCAWTLTQFHGNGNHCWEGYGDQNAIWIIAGPMVTFLAFNCLLLINIIKVLTFKLVRNQRLRNSSSHVNRFETTRTALKSTFFLIPLLGLSHGLFLFNIKNSPYELYYLYFNSFIQSFQGILVSILYCFCGNDVQDALKNSFKRSPVVVMISDLFRESPMSGHRNTESGYRSGSNQNIPLQDVTNERDGNSLRMKEVVVTIRDERTVSVAVENATY